MQYVKWLALRTYDFGTVHVSLRAVTRPGGFAVEHRKRGRGTSGIVLVTGGEICFHQNGQPDLTAKANDLCLLPQDSRYQLLFRAAENSLILLNFALITPSGEPITPGKQVEMLQSPVTDPKLLRFFEKLPASFPASETGSSFRGKEQLYKLFSMLFEETRIDLSPHPKFASIVPGAHLLEQTFLENLPIACYAEACNISLSSFRSLFAEFYGISPLRYRNRLRIYHARVMLMETHCTVEEAARCSGFDNTGYFCRLYKKTTGETPGQTRSRHWE